MQHPGTILYMRKQTLRRLKCSGHCCCCSMRTYAVQTELQAVTRPPAANLSQLCSSHPAAATNQSVTSPTTELSPQALNPSVPLLTKAMLSHRRHKQPQHVGMLTCHDHTTQEAVLLVQSTNTQSPHQTCMYATPCTQKKLARQGRTARQCLFTAANQLTEHQPTTSNCDTHRYSN